MDTKGQQLELVISSIILLNRREGTLRARLKVLTRLIQGTDTRSNINMRSLRVLLALGLKGPMKEVRKDQCHLGNTQRFEF